MARKSELEQFLASHSAEGEVDSQGAFTLGGAKALRKIAQYQLPFDGAWMVKIIQSIVASGSTDPIRVDLAATEIRVQFKATSFTLEEFETAFHTPEASPNRALRYLLSGLWAVGLKERWGFQVAFPGQKNTLIWDGERLNRVGSSVTRERTCISVAPLRHKTALSWVSGVAASGRRNAELLVVLGRFCYPCPLPLSVDGRRIDTLQRAEHHGWSRQTYPLGVGYAEVPLPEFGLPPGTFQGLPQAIDDPPVGAALFDDREGGGWRAVAEKRMKNLSARPRAALAYILCVNMKNAQSGQAYFWEVGKGPSTVYWVLDGVLVGEDALFLGASHCSIGCFLNADGLRIDLSGFALLESPERTQRLGLARQALVTAVGSFDDSDFDDLSKEAGRPQRMMGGFLVVAGVLLLCATPVVGIFAPLGGGALSLYGGMTLRADFASEERLRVQAARAGLRELRGRLAQTPKSRPRRK